MVFTYKYIPFERYPEIVQEFLAGQDWDHDVFVDPEIICQNLDFGPPIPYPDLRLRLGIKGAAVLVDDEFQIYVDEYHYNHEERSCNFTIGEELGHIAMHLKEYQGTGITVDEWARVTRDLSKRDNKYLHQQARCFSSHLLLPQSKLTDYAISVVQEHYHEIDRGLNFSDDLLADTIADYLYDSIPLSR